MCVCSCDTMEMRGWFRCHRFPSPSSSPHSLIVIVLCFSSFSFSFFSPSSFHDKIPTLVDFDNAISLRMQSTGTRAERNERRLFLSPSLITLPSILCFTAEAAHCFTYFSASASFSLFPHNRLIMWISSSRVA